MPNNSAQLSSGLGLFSDNEPHTPNPSSSRGCYSQSLCQSWSPRSICAQLVLCDSNNLYCILYSNIFGNRVAWSAKETPVFLSSLFFKRILVFSVPHWSPRSKIFSHNAPF